MCEGGNGKMILNVKGVTKFFRDKYTIQYDEFTLHRIKKIINSRSVLKIDKRSFHQTHAIHLMKASLYCRKVYLNRNINYIFKFLQFLMLIIKYPEYQLITYTFWK